MKKIFTLLLLAWVSIRVGAQHEIALNDIGTPILPIAAAAASSAVHARSSPAAVSRTVFFSPALTVEEMDCPASYPPAIRPIEKPEFGTDFTITEDTLTGHRIIDLRRDVSELMVFARDNQGTLVMARLLHMVRTVELDIPEHPGTYFIELLTREGDKATLCLD